ncbi:MAG: UbiX family flavin prenyltransferase [Phycisphaerales bacterium]|nr:UbiX family flavin prenyltransferase [Phycisphaerales bacterium]|tara:strand:+ start:11098 stop:11700 length:603 start_codon:yes stop_codon:yes gene_type:complete
MHQRIVIGITGASGAPYTVRFLELMARQGVELHVSASALGRRLLFEEQDIRHFTSEALVGSELADQLIIHSDNDFGAIIASGSFQHDGMVILPCSSNTLNSIAAGITSTLVHRAAMVCLKERRKLLIAHRESPLSPIDIESMASLTRAGATIVPLAPGFYMRPERVEDLIDFMVARLMDQLGYDHGLKIRWKGEADEVSS